MSKLDGPPSDHLRTALDEAEDAKAAKRLMVALAYKDGVDVDTISERYDISNRRSTTGSIISRINRSRTP